MAKSKHNKPVATMAGKLQYVTITGDGRNGAMPGMPENMQYSASVIFKKNSKEHKAILALIKEAWVPYAKENGIKAAPATNGIKPVMIVTDELDEYDAPIKKETDDVIVSFKTGVAWPDGKKKVIDAFQPSGKKITEVIHAAEWTIGNDTIGILHGVASPNGVGGTEKVSLYLSGVQLVSGLVKYTGTAAVAEEVEGADDMDLGVEGAVEAAPEADQSPDI